MAIKRSESTSSETDLLLPTDPESVPRDRLLLVYIIFYLLGIGTLLPWNFFSNAKQYFMYKLRNVTVDYNGSYHYEPETATEMQVMFENYLSLAAMLPTVLFMFLNTAATKLIPLKYRMVGAALVMIAMFSLTVVLVKVDTDTWQTQFFGVTLVTIIIMNAGSAVLQGGIFGLSSMFPGKYTQSVMGGMGMGGTMAATANILATAFAGGPLEMGFGYFLTAAFVIVLALLGYLSLPFYKFARYHTGRASNTAPSAVNDKDVVIESRLPDVRIQATSLIDIFKKLWWYAGCVFVVFCVTLSCYPSVNSNIQSMNYGPHGNAWDNTYFMPVSCFLIFNFGDLFGRTLAGFVQWPREDSVLLPIFCLSRVIFIPLFMMCNVQPRNSNIPVIFDADWIPMLLMSIFAISNGYLGTLAMMFGPRRIPREDLETAGSMMSFFLSSGLAAGSILSFLLVKAV